MADYEKGSITSFKEPTVEGQLGSRVGHSRNRSLNMTRYVHVRVVANLHHITSKWDFGHFTQRKPSSLHSKLPDNVILTQVLKPFFCSVVVVFSGPQTGRSMMHTGRSELDPDSVHSNPNFNSKTHWSILKPNRTPQITNSHFSKILIVTVIWWHTTQLSARQDNDLKIMERGVWSPTTTRYTLNHADANRSALFI